MNPLMHCLISPLRVNVFCIAALCLPVSVSANDIKADCEADLELLPRFLSANDAGASFHKAEHGEAYFQKAFEIAKHAMASVKTEADCEQVLDSYVYAWRPDHIGITSTTVEGIPSVTAALKREPSLEHLSEKTLLITIPSFNARYREAITELLDSNVKELSARNNWIIDVRKNSGGSDSSYSALLPWLMSGEYTEVGAEFLVSERNFAATKNVCERYAPGDKSCEESVAAILKKMRVANQGDYVPLFDSIIAYKQSATKEKRPQRVAVLIDKHCGSSCEQFLLAVRQSFSVKLIGRNTAGALDFSNLRPYTLPSGKRDLMYATSRSARLPIMPVDAAGVMPDIYLPPPADDKAYAEEITRVKNWLEGGTLAPL